MQLNIPELNTEDLVAAVLALPKYFLELQIPEVQIEYGFGSGLHVDLLYKSMRQSTKHLASFIQQSLDQNIFRPGLSDLIFFDTDRTFEILVCHESDIHIKSLRPDIIDYFKHALAHLDPIEQLQPTIST